MSSNDCRFFVPGPTWVRPELLSEMARPIIGHRSSEFRELFAGILSNLRSLFRTSENAFVATTSGTGLMEAALINCVPRSVLVTTCGAFSERWLRIAQQLGLEADHLDHPWGSAVSAERLRDHMRSRHHHYDAVTITHNETSTGVMNDVAELAAVVHEESPDTLVLVDAVSSLGSAELLFDQWKLDVCLASTQKGLALPPGLAVFAVSERAFQKAARQPYRGMYFDFMEYRRHAGEGSAAFTPAISLCYAMAKQLDYIIGQETLERRWKRHEQLRVRTWERTATYAKPLADEEFASKSISALAPLNKPAPDVVSEMKARGFTLGGGYGQLRESTFRIGHMGDIQVDALDAMLDVLEEVCAQ